MNRHELKADDFAGLAAALRAQAAEGGADGLEAVVEKIIADVRTGGDAALVTLTRELDCPGFSADQLRVPSERIQAAAAEVDGRLLEALQLAVENIRFFHQHEMRGNWTASMRQSQMLGQRMIPVERVGLYVPGGGASYPSSVLMTAVPAQVAGVPEIFICTPPSSEGEIDQAVLAAAALLEVEEIYMVGGAQAVAAMAYGTESIRPADVVCGPGNMYVTEAKRQVYGRVGIDSLAGPSEVLIIADDEARPDLIAIDLLAQVEHGSGAISAVVCWSGEQAAAIEEHITRQAAELGIAAALVERISIITIPAAQDPLALAIAFSNYFGPEHLQLHTLQPEQDVQDVSSAGAVFLGEKACTAYGDYIVGSNHVLPTGGSARYSSSLSVDNFLRKVAVISLIPETIAALTPSLIDIARTEGLSAHARAGEMRQQLYAPPGDDEK